MVKDPSTCSDLGTFGVGIPKVYEVLGLGRTERQKVPWLPQVANGEVLPTAVFTEPEVRSGLGSMQTPRATVPSGQWVIDGAKAWITHASRSDLMTTLCCTLPDAQGYAGLSMLLVP